MDGGLPRCPIRRRWEGCAAALHRHAPADFSALADGRTWKRARAVEGQAISWLVVCGVWPRPVWGTPNRMAGRRTWLLVCSGRRAAIWPPWHDGSEEVGASSRVDGGARARCSEMHNTGWMDAAHTTSAEEGLVPNVAGQSYFLKHCARRVSP